MFLQRCGSSPLSTLSDAERAFSRNDFLCPDILYTNRCVVLFGTSLYAKDCSVMKACSTLEYTMCTHKQLLSSWREYGPSN